MDYDKIIIDLLEKILKEEKQHTLILNNIEKLFSKYDQEYLEEVEGENFPPG